MVDAASEFRKSGFSEEDSATLAGVSAMFQNVADDAISAVYGLLLVLNYQRQPCAQRGRGCKMADQGHN